MRDLELKPYALAGSDDGSHRDADAASEIRTLEVGGDAKYGITQNITADLTVNTDFAQVEVDEQQVNLTRFNLFFPEKRDFFLEGLGTFAFAGRASAGLGAGTGDTPYLFFSRRIGLGPVSRDPPAGRRTHYWQGRQGHIRRAERADRRRRQRPHRRGDFSVFRAKRDILRRSSIGGMWTHRSTTPGRIGSNDGYGIDATFSFHQNLRFDSYLAATRTYTQRPTM